MPSTYIALLCGINVGRAKRVAMADLRTLVEGLGFNSVRTLLNSGNIVFTGPKATPAGIAARIEKAMVVKLGFSARVIVLTAKELAAALAKNPLSKVADNPSRLLIALLGEAADRRKLMPLAKQDWGKEVLAVGKQVAYLWCADGINTSKLFESIQRTLANEVTTRNATTMQKLLALAEQSE